MNIRPRSERVSTIDPRDQSSIANRVYSALYGYEHVYIVSEGDNEVYGEGPLVYEYNNSGYTYNDYQDLQEYTYTITGESIQNIQDISR